MSKNLKTKNPQIPGGSYVTSLYEEPPYVHAPSVLSLPSMHNDPQIGRIDGAK